MTRKDGRIPAADSGFTLIEALVAIVILSFGLMAVTNLLIVAAASNTVGNHSTAATTLASETLERLKSRTFTSLTAGGDVDAGTMGNISNCNETPTLPPAAPNTAECVVTGNFNMRRDIPGVGAILTFWEIRQIDGQTLFIRVRSQSTAALAGARSRAEFTTFRSCTSTSIGCPNP
jgi:prepilin-type N-terminal cleavage/methylation domain-containing protein